MKLQSAKLLILLLFVPILPAFSFLAGQQHFVDTNHMFSSTVTPTPILIAQPGEIDTESQMPLQLTINFQVPQQTTTPEPRLTADRWRDWPVIPTLSSRAQEILESNVKNTETNLHSFSRVGDCQFTSMTFLAPYAKGIYPIPEGYEETIHYFKESMVRDSITSANGLGINSVLNPLFGAGAGYTQCDSNETPLDCEIRTRHPSIILVAMGTNWKPFAEITFEENLRLVIEKILASGALPILATKADNIETDWKLNLAIARVAYDYDLPLLNLWLAVQYLPNHGLVSPKNEYLTGEGCMTQNYAWLRMLEVVRYAIETE